MLLALLPDRVGQGKFLVLHSVKKNPGAKASGFFCGKGSVWKRNGCNRKPRAFGVDPIHFGVVLVCCCGVGFSTPPLGENIFIASGIADTTLEDISYNALPFVFVTVGVIILCVFVPDIVLFLPRMMY